jgi:uncharacterized membrane protein (UPF0182 family)
MKLDISKVYLSIIIVLLAVITFQYVCSSNTISEYDTRIEKLTQKNDSLFDSIEKTNTKISSLNSKMICVIMSFILCVVAYIVHATWRTIAITS